MKRLLSSGLVLLLVGLMGSLALAGSKYAKNAARQSYEKKSETEKNILGAYKRKRFNFYAWGTELDLGQQIHNMQLKKFEQQNILYDRPEHKEILDRVLKISEKILAISDVPNLPLSVHVVDKPDIVNAFSMPGCHLVVFTGLWDEKNGLVDLPSDDEIAAVMAHEIAHATMRHITRRLTTMQGWGIFGTAVAIGLNTTVGASAVDIFAQAFRTTTSLYLPTYTRKFEREADRVGLYYMALAGYDPQAVVKLWQRAAAKNAKKGEDPKRTSFFASHPASGERAINLQHFLPEALQLQLRVKNGEKLIARDGV